MIGSTTFATTDERLADNSSYPLPNGASSAYTKSLRSLSEDVEDALSENDNTTQYTDRSFKKPSHAHSEFTLQTSNKRRQLSLLCSDVDTAEGKVDGLANYSERGGADTPMIPTTIDADGERRTIFGRAVQKRYAVADAANALVKRSSILTGESLASSLSITDDERSLTLESPDIVLYESLLLNGDSRSSSSIVESNPPPLTDVIVNPPTPSPSTQPLHEYLALQTDHHTSKYNSLNSRTSNATPRTHHHRNSSGSRKRRPHETIHAQSLLLGVAFAFVWSPSNMMAPNLTEMAMSFGLNDPSQRDLYLGSYCALATGVLSFPISAGIGITADLVSRQRLFVATVTGGAVASILTGLSTKYWHLILARLLNGGFMSGSVPVAFSFLGDLFATEERNAASSGLTAMMGLGIILGQVYSGIVGSTLGWSHAFFVSGACTLVLAVLCLFLVQEPVRGGKEKVLQDMIKAGTRYERQLTWDNFAHAMRHNRSNTIILWQGLFSSIPWGVIFVFLNDYLSQERGFSVPDATFLVLVFGIGCAAGGILGGFLGQKAQSYDRSYLPLFMSATTFLGIIPFVLLLNLKSHDAHSFRVVSLSFLAGLVPSLPSVNVRPCLINVNPPETRGASLTTANLIINLARGIGPSCITLMGSIFHVNRQFSINCTMAVFWAITSIQLLFLAKTLPKDQDAMEADLANYAKQALQKRGGENGNDDDGDEDSQPIVSIRDRITSFDNEAVQQTITYMSESLKELRDGGGFAQCAWGEEMSETSSVEDESLMQNQSEYWRQQRHNASSTHNESTPLIV